MSPVHATAREPSSTVQAYPPRWQSPFLRRANSATVDEPMVQALRERHETLYPDPEDEFDGGFIYDDQAEQNCSGELRMDFESQLDKQV